MNCKENYIVGKYEKKNRINENRYILIVYNAGIES